MKPFISYFLSLIIIFILLGVTAFFPIRAAEETVTISASVFYAEETHQFFTTDTFSESLINPNGTKCDIDFPEDALSSGDQIEMNMYSTSESVVVSNQPLPSGKLAADTFYNFSFTKVSDSSEITLFDSAITLTFYYTDTDISGIDEATLVAHRWDGTSWVAISNSTINTANNTVTITTQLFSFFALLGTAPSVGGGGGPGYVPFFLRGKVTLQGKAYPEAKITILKDGQIAATVTADSQANFKAEIINITAGTYTFGFWAEDTEGKRSITINFTTDVTERTTTTISGIFLPPTIGLNKTYLQKGKTLNISGQTAPESEVSIFVSYPEMPDIIKKTKARTDGIWFYSFDTSVLDEDPYTVRVKATSLEGLLSTFSQFLAFSIGKEITEVIKKADINEDGKVNLVDFSILLFNWGIPKNLGADLNNDGEIDLVDFSIMMYYWTG